jgi:hypothetical protein
MHACMQELKASHSGSNSPHVRISVKQWQMMDHIKVRCGHN